MLHRRAAAAMWRITAATLLGCVLCTAWAADPGEQWFTADAAAPPDTVQWLAPASLCQVSPAKLGESVQLLSFNPFVALTAKTLVDYAGSSCKGKYGQLPYLVRAVSSAGEGQLEAGRLNGDLWIRYAALGGKYPFEKTPVVLWLDVPPVEVHVSVSLVE
jgi:hypothetical protein